MLYEVITDCTDYALLNPRQLALVFLIIMDKRVKILLFVFNLTIQVLGQDMKTIDSICPPITIIDSTFRIKVDSVITSGYYKVKSIGTENLINYINISNDSSRIP